ncbi:MAG: hypothetical protein RL022_3146, partial [Chloroflexota bacterium]
VDPRKWTVVAGKPGGRNDASGRGAGEFFCPQGIAVDGNGAVWVADTFNNRIQVRDPDGRWRVAGGKVGGGDGAIGHGAGEFYSPWGIAVDGNGAVWVADSGTTGSRCGNPTGGGGWLVGRRAGVTVRVAAAPGSSAVPMASRWTGTARCGWLTLGTTGSRCGNPTGSGGWQVGSRAGVMVRVAVAPGSSMGPVGSRWTGTARCGWLTRGTTGSSGTGWGEGRVIPGAVAGGQRDAVSLYHMQ